MTHDGNHRIQDIPRLHFPNLVSTNSHALEWMRGSQKADEVVMFSHDQTGGRGQAGKTWDHIAPKDLAWTYARRLPPVSSSASSSTAHLRLSQLNMGIALALHRAVSHSMKGEQASMYRIKWPNDLLIAHEGKWKKCAGILIENQWKGDRIVGIIIGIGMNLSPEHAQHPQRINLDALHSTPLEPDKLQASLLQQVVHTVDAFLQNRIDYGDTSEAYHDALFGKGEWHWYRTKGKTLRGALRNIDENGCAWFDWEQPHPGSLPEGPWSSGSIQCISEMEFGNQSG